VTMGIDNSTPVVGDSYDIVGWHAIDDVVHGFWAHRAAAHHRRVAGHHEPGGRPRPASGVHGRDGTARVRP